MNKNDSRNLKQMWQEYQPDVKYNTRVSRYYNTGDPAYRPNPRKYLKKICPAHVPYKCFCARVRLWGLDRAISEPYHGRYYIRKNSKKLLYGEEKSL